MTKPRRSLLVAVAAVPALAVMATAFAAGKAPVPFSHQVHVEARCETCHDPSSPGLPTLDRGACKFCHRGGTPDYRPLPRRRTVKLVFPHQAHTTAIPDCKACHAGVLSDKATRLSAEACFRCHASRKVAVPARACARCHGENERQVEPPDHRAGWLRTHGREADWRALPAHGKDCATCHGKASCRACHDQMMPRSHTGLFRTRTHGRLAAWDRDSCRTCHETGTCIRCHRSTPPLNHRGNWLVVHGMAAGSLTNERCAVCHQAGFCDRCH